MATVEEAVLLDYCDVLIKPKRSALPSRDIPLENLTRTFRTRWHNEPLEAGIPIIASNMDHTGTVAMAAALGEIDCHTALHKHHTAKQLKAHFSLDPAIHPSRAWITIGMNADILKEIKLPTPLMICIDIANGYLEKFSNFVGEIRARYPEAWIMAGNVATYEATQQLVLSGADIVKVGIGPGSVCTTRKVAGVGIPQLSAVLTCADAAHGLKALVCADGGCIDYGDVSKAFGAGADFVMLGGMLAGHTECDGKVTTEAGAKPVMKFYGMSSALALEKYDGGTKSYRAPEGKVVFVQYKGSVQDTVQLILGGVKSAMTYTGAERLKDLSKCTTFVRVSRQLNNSLR